MSEHHRLEFSKKIIIFASVIYALTWVVMVVSWFLYRDFPMEIKEFTTYIYGVAIAFYFGKSAYEKSLADRK